MGSIRDSRDILFNIDERHSTELKGKMNIWAVLKKIVVKKSHVCEKSVKDDILG